MQDHTPTDSGSASPPGHLYPGPTAPLGWRGHPACHCALAGTACAPPRCRPPPLPAPRPRRGVRSLTRRPQQQRRTQTHAPGAPTTRLAPAGAALAGTRPTVPSGTPLPWEALLTRWAQPQSPRGAPGEQGPAAPTLAHGDLEAQGCEEAREAGTAGGGLTPANVSRTLGGPTASYTGHGRPSKWLTPAHGWRRP